MESSAQLPKEMLSRYSWRACADVDAGPDRCVSDIGQVVDLTAVRDRAFFDFDEITDLYSVSEFSARPQSREWTDLTVVSCFRALDVTVWMDNGAAAYFAVTNHVVRFDSCVVAQANVSFEHSININKDVFTAG